MDTNMITVTQTSLKTLNSLFEMKYDEYVSFAEFKARQRGFYFGVRPCEVVHMAYLYAQEYVVPRGFISHTAMNNMILKIIEQRLIDFVRREGRRKSVESNYCITQYDSSEQDYLELVKCVAEEMEGEEEDIFTILAMRGTVRQARDCVQGLTNYRFYNGIKQRIETKTKTKLEELCET